MKKRHLFATEGTYEQVGSLVLDRPKYPAVIVDPFERVIREGFVPARRDLAVELPSNRRTISAGMAHTDGVPRSRRCLNDPASCSIGVCRDCVDEYEVDGLADRLALIDLPEPVSRRAAPVDQPLSELWQGVKRKVYALANSGDWPCTDLGGCRLRVNTDADDNHHEQGCKMWTSSAPEATGVRKLACLGHWSARSPWADLLPCNNKVVGLEPVNATEWLVQHRHHVDDHPYEQRQHATENEMGRPTELEEPQHQDVQHRSNQDHIPDDRRDAGSSRLDAHPPAIYELGEDSQRFLMKDILPDLAVRSKAEKKTT
jgi:hypothetical protein